MPTLFGTDGVRGVAGVDLTDDLARDLGRAAGRVLGAGRGRFVVGRDTRLSGPMLQRALTEGLRGSGSDVLDIGVVPTPAVAYLTQTEGATAGSMISASHNPVDHNGIKFFAASGLKVERSVEGEIEAAMADVDQPGAVTGRVDVLEEAVAKYLEHLLAAVSDLSGVHVVLDCAFGSAWAIAPRAFQEAGAKVTAINDEPDGGRINVDCGSTSLDGLARRVVEEGADLGLGFDGDADRVLAVDESGRVVDGDRIIGLSALRMKEAGHLGRDLVVATVMSNLGFRRALEAHGIEVLTADVGDRNVVEMMIQKGAVLGGEQSGHVIFSDHSTTGDGILTGLQVARAVAEAGPLSGLAGFFEPYPQVLINVPVPDKSKLEGAAAIWDAVAAAEGHLGPDGRVLLRPSGTESIVRVMVEAFDAVAAESTARSLADLVAASLA